MIIFTALNLQIHCFFNDQKWTSSYQRGWKKLASKPLQTKFHTPLTITNTLSPRPKQPRPRVNHHLIDVGCLFITIHIKHGYPNVRCNANPPTNSARLGRNGNTTDIKKVIPPKKILIPIRTNFGHSWLVLLT